MDGEVSTYLVCGNILYVSILSRRLCSLENYILLYILDYYSGVDLRNLGDFSVTENSCPAYLTSTWAEGRKSADLKLELIEDRY